MLSSIYFMYPISVDRRKRECFPEKILVIKTVLNWVPLFSFFFGFHSLFSLLLREDVIFYGGLTKIERNWRLSIKPREDFAMGTTYNMFSQCLPHLGIGFLSEGAPREGSSVVTGGVSHSRELFAELVASPVYPPPAECWSSVRLFTGGFCYFTAGRRRYYSMTLFPACSVPYVGSLRIIKSVFYIHYILAWLFHFTSNKSPTYILVRFLLVRFPRGSWFHQECENRNPEVFFLLNLGAFLNLLALGF